MRQSKKVLYELHLLIGRKNILTNEQMCLKKLAFDKNRRIIK